MKFLYGLIIVFLTPSTVFGQGSDADREAKAVYSKQDSMPRQIFLDQSALGDLKMSSDKRHMRVWRSPNADSTALVAVYDIRLKFEDEGAALAFHTRHFAYNSENMPEVSGTDFHAAGCKEFRAFEDDAMYKMFGFNNLENWCFLFVDGRYLVKLFVNCNKKVPKKDLQVLIDDIVRRMDKVK